MARKQSWNPRPLLAELSAADDVINPLLDAAKITSIKVSGADRPASDAPLPDRISAFANVTKTGATSADAVELATLNGQITAQLEKSDGELAVAKSSVATLTQEKTALTADLATSRTSVDTLTASNAELGNRNTVLAKNLEISAGNMNALNRTLSQFCLRADCLSLVGEDGKAFGKDATEEHKLLAADKIPVSEKFTALFGAVNAAVAKTGVSFAALPTAVPGGTQAGAPKFKSATELCAAAVAAKAQGKPIPAYESIKGGRK